jgi:hypothetical protein
MSVQDRTPEILDTTTACTPHGLFADDKPTLEFCSSGKRSEVLGFFQTRIKRVICDTLSPVTFSR